MAGTSGHLTGFKVANFKRFDSFEMTDLGQFNLILGDNNVGKTSVLEALLVCNPPELFVARLAKVLSYRNVRKELVYEDFELLFYKSVFQRDLSPVCSFVEIFGELQKRTSATLDVYNSILAVQGSRLDPRSFLLSERVAVSVNLDIPLIPFYRGHDHDLLRFYGQIQKSGLLKERFIRAMAAIIADISNLEPSTDSESGGVIVFQSGVDPSIPLAMFGDGALKLFRFLAQIIAQKGSRLMIDEIDTGIHFSRLKEFWRVILKTAIDNDVQLFMTTHSEECVRFFKEVLEEELSEYKERARAISLVEHRETKKVTAHTYPFEQFEHAINVGNEIRG